MATTPRSYAAGSFSLVLDGKPCGFLKSAEGGGAVADVVVEKPGTSGASRKHLGGVRYEDLALRVGLGGAAALYDWIAATWQGKPLRHDGSVLSLDRTGKVVRERAFSAALVTSVTVPKLDGASKDPAFLTVRLAPERVQRKDGGAKAQAPAAKAQKQWVASNFRLELGTLDCSKVASIESFTVKQTVLVDDGEIRRRTRGQTALEFPNLRVALAAVGAKTWFDWHEDFVVQGNNGQDRELAGAIVLLAPDRKAELARIELQQVGISALREPAPSAADQVARVVAELYCEGMTLSVKP
jgi:hypothetical protein